MKKIVLGFICLLITVTAGFSQSYIMTIGVGAGAEYNPLNPDYLAWNAGVNIGFPLGGNHKIFYEMRFGGGVMAYYFEGPNPYTVQHEDIPQWEKGSLDLIVHLSSVFWQYDFNSIIGVRAGLGFSNLNSSVFYRNSGGWGLYTRAGISLFPAGKFSVAIEANPGWLHARYPTRDTFSGGDNLSPFICPITLMVCYNFDFDLFAPVPW